MDECSYCLNEIDPEINYSITECGHKFHSSCIFNILKNYNNCPICRETLIDKNSIKINDINHGWYYFFCVKFLCKVRPIFS